MAVSKRASGTPDSGNPKANSTARPSGRAGNGAAHSDHSKLLDGLEAEAEGAGYELASEPTTARQSDDRLEGYVRRTSTRSSATLTALSAFQQAADAYPPLNPQQQLDMHKVWLAGETARAQLERGRLGAAKQREARNTVRAAEQAMQHLCASCWRLAWVIVREQAEERFGRDKAQQMLPDLMGEANMALVDAVRTFDCTMTPQFGTYAARKVRDHTRAVLAKDAYIKMAASWGRLKRIAVARIPELTMELGRKPSKEELQDSLLTICLDWADRRLTDEQRALPEPQRQALRLAKLRKQGMLSALRDIDDVLIASQGVSSLDAPVGEEGASTLGDLLADRHADAAYQQVEQAEVAAALRDALEQLPDRERQILLLRYGFVDGDSWTYERIAEQFGVTSERIRQIEKSVVGKLRSPHGQFSFLHEFRDDQ